MNAAIRSRAIASLSAALALPLAPAAAAAPEAFVIAVAPSITSALDVVGVRQGFFAKEGLDVRLADAGSGIAAVGMMLAGEADAAVSTAFPLISASFDRDGIRIFAVTNVSGNDNMVVARRDRGIDSIAKLAGRKVGVLEGGLPEYALDLMLLDAGLSKREVDLVRGDLPSLYARFADGSLDALCCFGGWVGRAAKALPGATVVLGDETLLRVATTLSTTSDRLAARPGTFVKLLRAYVAAEAWVAKHPDAALDLVVEWFKLDKAATKAVWKPGLFRVRLDQSMIRDLENLARWQIEEGPRKDAAMPDVLDLFDFRPLEAVDPERVTIIH